MVAKVVVSSLRGGGRAVECSDTDTDAKLVNVSCFMSTKTYTTINTAIKTEANPAQVIHAIFSNLRTLAHSATISAAIIEK
jgi:hypothetical protein